MNGTCAILLAAGQSTRMGEPKQLLAWQGRSLIEYQICKLARLPFSKIVAVIGHQAETIENQVRINDSRFSWIINTNYTQGLSTSIKAGLSEALKYGSAAFILLVDLPLIHEKTFLQIYEKGADLLKNKKEPFLVQPTFENQRGHPIFLGNFQCLPWNKLTGDQGAKPLWSQVDDQFLLPTKDNGIIFDIDTRKAYAHALNELSNNL